MSCQIGASCLHMLFYLGSGHPGIPPVGVIYFTHGFNYYECKDTIMNNKEKLKLSIFFNIFETTNFLD